MVLLERVFNNGTLVPCPNCETPLQVEVFPALFRPIKSGCEGEALMVEGESGCFFHPQKKAVIPCESCGRFLCSLCDCELHGSHYCPACVEAGTSKGKIKSLENKRTLYDSIALSVAVVPFIIPFLSILTAPIAILIAVRYWNASLSIVQRSRVRFVIAIMVALLQIGIWSLACYYYFLNRNG
ncbi:MAG TPA: B-box zinc finger protein [Candidatus Limnocylindria bacterium]|jgi:hypothetical protein|nr:B-box zinc finger protein [Candidatus Limnocylindria bacterium]